MVCPEGVRIGKYTRWITSLADVDAMLLTVCKWDVAEVLVVAILKVFNSGPNRTKACRFFCRVVLGTGGKGAENVRG